MSVAFFPSCYPFGDFVVFLHEDKVDVIVQSHALTALIGPAASFVDAMAEDVEQVGETVWKFTYQVPLWYRLCNLLHEIYAPAGARRDDKEARILLVKPTGQVKPVPIIPSGPGGDAA